jgi:transposase
VNGYRQANLFELDDSILLYDLTNTHFEGVCAANPKAKRGKNKQGRDDCAQIVVGMVFDGRGFELTHCVFEGSRHDSKTLPDMVKQLQSQVQRPAGTPVGARPLVIVDGGIATAKNLSLLRANHYDYLVNDSRRGRSHYALEFAGNDKFAVIKDREDLEPVSVRLLSEEHEQDGKKYTEQVVLCKSGARGDKERAILSSAEKRFLTALQGLKERIAKGRLKDETKIQQAIGRLKARNTRVQRYYTIELTGGVLNAHRLDEQLDKALELSGCYVLRTNRQRLDAQSLWRLYMTLLHAEEGFRSLKSELGLRPNFHQKEPRVEGHVFITILAYQLLCFIRETLRRAEINCNWETIRRLLSTHCYATIVLPVKGGKTYRIMKASTPDEQQNRIYQIFGIDWKSLPKSKTLHQ